MEKDYFKLMDPELQEKLVLWMAKITARLEAEKVKSKKSA